MVESVPSPFRRTLVIAAVASLFLISACQSMDAMAPKKSLYDRLGGQPAVTAVVDDFVGNVAADNRINGFFARDRHPAAQENLVDQICQGTGGPARTPAAICAPRSKGMNITGRAVQRARRGPGEDTGQVQGAREGEGRAPGCPGSDEAANRRSVAFAAIAPVHRVRQIQRPAARDGSAGSFLVESEENSPFAGVMTILRPGIRK